MNDRKKIISAFLAVIGTLSVPTLIAADANAQNRAAPARSHTPGARGTVAGVRGSTVHAGARVGVYFSAPFIASPWWYSPYPYSYPYSYPYTYGYGPYYYPPPVYIQEQPSVYVERQSPPPAAPQAQPEPYWYYCQDSKTYFPYVQTCATPWQRVVPYAPQ
jgi:hypothetical protein